MKRILVLLLSLLILVSCGSGDGESSDSTAETTAAETVPLDPLLVDFSYSNGYDDNGYYEGIKALDHVELCEYKGILIPKSVYDASDEEVEAKVMEYLSDFAEVTEYTDREVKSGDFVNIDYSATIDGEQFEGGSTQNQGSDVIIGDKNNLPGLMNQLIGHKPGENVKATYTFDDDYDINPDLAGKTAEFTVTINYIFEIDYPELTDEFVTANFAEQGWTSRDDLYDGVYAELSHEEISAYLQEYLLENCTVDVPDEVYNIGLAVMTNYYYNTAGGYGQTLDQLAQNYGFKDWADFRPEVEPTVLEGSQVQMIFKAIAESEGLTAEKEDMEEYVAAQKNIASPQSFVMSYGLPYLKHMTLQEMAVEILIDSAILEE